MGTGGELVLPVLLVLGLGGRFAAAGPVRRQRVAVLSLADIAPAALQQHVFWGSLLLACCCGAPGRWSLDRLVTARLTTAEPATLAGYTRAA
jgi:putative oxidoreductase